MLPPPDHAVSVTTNLEGTMTVEERAELMRQWRREQAEDDALTEAARRLLERVKGSGR
jgi:C4-type Zn-finger protein